MSTQHQHHVLQTVFDLAEQLPKYDLVQIAIMLAQNLSHHRQETGVEIPIEETMLFLNNQPPTEPQAVVSAEALAELASLLAWQVAGKSNPSERHQLH